VKITEPVTELVLGTEGPTELVRREEALLREGGSPADLAAARAVLPALAQAAGEVVDAAGVRARLHASLGRRGRYGIFADRLARMFQIGTADAEALAKMLEDPKAWKPFAGWEVIAVAPGEGLKGALSTVVKFRPGAIFPMHEHLGDELNFLLEGGFRESSGGVEVWRGEELFKPAGSSHEFTILPGSVCIAAVVATRGIDL
jgi:quercetin dioxygenase-like cupin family protein